MLPLWVLLDARTRTERAMPLAVFVLLTNFVGWLTYLVIRPESNRVCPNCIMFMEPGFRICPTCGWNGDVRCRHCRRPLRSHWRFCPYCEAPRPEPVTDAPPGKRLLLDKVFREAPRAEPVTDASAEL
jgi:RNA polymerase subunit RPABC4/transcription elongation factor Spt4